MNEAKRPFVDSNVVVYLMSGDRDKAGKAESIIAKGGVISVQVLNEFTSVARRKLALTWVEIEEVIEALKTNLEVVPLTLSVYERARALAAKHEFNFYDASIIAAALANGCDVVLSEDLQHGQKLAALRIENPFR